MQVDAAEMDADNTVNNEETNPSTEDDKDPNVKTTRSGRISKPPAKLTMAQHHLHTQACKQEMYSIENARLIGMTMCHINEMLLNPRSKKAIQFGQSYSLMKGLKKFGQSGRDAAFKEIKQLHDRVVFELIRVEDLTYLRSVERWKV